MQDWGLAGQTARLRAQLAPEATVTCWGGRAGAFVPVPGSPRTVGTSSDGARPGAGGGPRRWREALGLLGMCGSITSRETSQTELLLRVTVKILPPG